MQIGKEEGKGEKKQQIKGTDQPGGGDWGAKEENINQSITVQLQKQLSYRFDNILKNHNKLKKAGYYFQYQTRKINLKHTNKQKYRN